jgi:hypothetical protein
MILHCIKDEGFAMPIILPADRRHVSRLSPRFGSSEKCCIESRAAKFNVETVKPQDLLRGEHFRYGLVRKVRDNINGRIWTPCKDMVRCYIPQ